MLYNNEVSSIDKGVSGMNYVDKDIASRALKEMKRFHDDIVSLYASYNMDLLDNLGRRNIVMSQAQEKFFSQFLSEKFEGVYNDGKTGQPDIVIESLGKELECKLTSRHKSGAISLQTDYETLNQKGSLDYLYVIANPAFSEFAVLFFKGLDTDDFNPPANGSRGKVSMKKHKAMKKCDVLVGSVLSLNDFHLQALRMKKLLAKTEKSLKKIEEKISYWSTVPNKYRFELEEISA